MSVAKSYQNYEIVKEPYENNDKFYVDIDFKGKIKTVRWYEEPMKKIRPLKEVLGFAKGYITIFKGDTYSLLDWFRAEEACRYHTFWGWYVPSELEMPTIPAGLEIIQLKWEDVAFADEDQLRPESQIKEHIDSLMYDPSPSKWQGEVGDRLEKVLTVTKVIPIEGYYGNSTMHIFSDPEENVYVWTTAAKTLEIGESYLLKGTIKQLSVYKNQKQTILTRCKILDKLN